MSPSVIKLRLMALLIKLMRLNAAGLLARCKKAKG